MAAARAVVARVAATVAERVAAERAAAARAVAARAALRAVALVEGSWEDGAEAVGMAVAVKAAVVMARRGDAGRVRSFDGARGGKGREEKSFAGACGDRTATAREVVRKV
jgi:hypothetical protein